MPLIFNKNILENSIAKAVEVRLNCMTGLLYSCNARPSCAKIAQIICRIDSAKSTAPTKRWGGRAILRTSPSAAVAAAIMLSTTYCVICFCPWQRHARGIARSIALMTNEYSSSLFWPRLSSLRTWIRVYSSSGRCLRGKTKAKSRHPAPPFSGIFIWSPK